MHRELNELKYNQFAPVVQLPNSPCHNAMNVL